MSPTTTSFVEPATMSVGTRLVVAAGIEAVHATVPDAAPQTLTLCPPSAPASTPLPASWPASTLPPASTPASALLPASTPASFDTAGEVPQPSVRPRRQQENSALRSPVYCIAAKLVQTAR